MRNTRNIGGLALTMSYKGGTLRGIRARAVEWQDALEGALTEGASDETLNALAELSDRDERAARQVMGVLDWMTPDSPSQRNGRP
jgi:hypothetical protein